MAPGRGTQRRESSLRAGRRNVRISHPDKLLFPADGITKEELATYYRDVAPAMVPHTKGRPLSLQRFHRGIGFEGFFQKDIGRGAPEWVHRVRVGKRGGSVCHPLADDAATLVWMASQNAITPHVWLARADALDRPDRLVFDLDPSREDFAAVRESALALGDALRERGLVPFAMVTGSRGVHVVCPLRRRTPTEQVLAFARSFAAEHAAQRPRALTVEFRKAERGQRIFLDVARNGRAQTVVPPYAVRARRGAPVATPIAWDELHDPSLRPDAWTIRTVLERVRSGDPWAGSAATPAHCRAGSSSASTAEWSDRPDVRQPWWWVVTGSSSADAITWSSRQPPPWGHAQVGSRGPVSAMPASVSGASSPASHASPRSGRRRPRPSRAKDQIVPSASSRRGALRSPASTFGVRTATRCAASAASVCGLTQPFAALGTCADTTCRPATCAATALSGRSSSGWGASASASRAASSTPSRRP